MEEVKYKFTVIARNSTKEVFPQNGNTLAVTWEKEEENAYFRKKLKGKMMFTGDDFHWLYVFESSQYRCDPIQLIIEKNCSEGFSQFFVARLILNNADWDLDQCTASIEAEEEDRYTCYNDNKGKEFNLLAITYPKQVVQLTMGTLEYQNCSGNSGDPQWCGVGDQAEGWVILRYYSVTTNPDFPDPTPHDQTFDITYVREVASSDVPLGDPWINIGGDQYARSPALYNYRSYGGQYDFGYDYQVGGTIDNGLKLKDAIQALLAQSCYTMKLKSNFFGWNQIPEMNKNILDSRRSTAGARLNATGDLIADSDPFRKVTDFIRVIPGTELWLQNPGTLGGNDINGFYDINKVFVSLAPPVPGASYPVKLADLPANVHYVRYQYYDRDVQGSELMLYMGTGEIPFQAYSYNNYATGLPSKVDNLILFQKSDVKRPGGSGNATISNTSLEKIIKDLCNMFNLKWDIDEEGNFILEHISFFQKGVGLNLIGRRDSRYRVGTRKYSYDVDSMPRREVFQMMDDKYTYGDFKGVPIVYSNSCVGQGDKEDKDWIVETIMTDVGLALNNSASDSQVVSDDGFILMACDENNNIISEASILGGNTLNNSLSWSHLHLDYWRHQRVFNLFSMNNVQTTALSVVPTKKRVPITLSLCCGEAFDPEAMVADEMGEGIVSQATFDLYRETLTLTLAYTADEDLVPNVAPVAVNDPVSTFVGLTIDIDVLANDTDTDGSITPESLTIVFGGAHGTSSVVNGKIRYTPNDGFIGEDLITYNVKDDWGESSNNAVISVTVKAGTPLPIAGNDVFRTGENVVLNVGTILSNDTGDGAISAVAETKATQKAGTVQIYANGSFVYTPASNFHGIDGFEYTLKDSNNNTDAGSVSIEVFQKQAVYVKYTEANNHHETMAMECMASGDTGGFGQTTIVGDRFVADQVFEYFSDSARTVPLDVTGYGLFIKVRRTRTGTNPGVYDMNISTSGIKTQIDNVVMEEDYYGCPSGTDADYTWTDTYQVLESADYSVGSSTTPDNPPVEPPAPTSLKTAGFPLGGLAKSATLNDTNQTTYLANETVGFTIENQFKPTAIFNSSGVANFTSVDAQLTWAKSHGLTVHGHTCWWPGHEPQYVKDMESNTALTVTDWENELKKQIQTPLLHVRNTPALAGSVSGWDIINEPFNEATTINTTGEIWKDSVFGRKLGRERAIILALQYAYQAYPEMLFFMNDYDYEFGWLKVDAMVAFAGRCDAQGIKMDGWGLQFHRDIKDMKYNGLRTNLQRLVNTGRKIHISEIGIKMRNAPYYDASQPFVLTPEIESAHSTACVALMNAFLTIPSPAQQYRFTFWGNKDSDYLGGNPVYFAMIMNNSWQRKKAYTDMLAEKIRLNNL